MHLNFAMEEELKCPVCHKLFIDPVILPCTHNLCIKCAETLKSKNGNLCDISPDYFGRTGLELDKVSLLSETVFSDTDSGYSGGSLGSNSSDQGRTVSLSSIGGASVHGAPSSPVSNFPKSWNQTTGIHLPSLPESISCLTCPICQRTVFLDDRGVDGLTKNILMLNIIQKFENRNCSPQNPVKAGRSQSEGRSDSQTLVTNMKSSTDDVHVPDNVKPVHKSQSTCEVVTSQEDKFPKCEMCDDNSNVSMCVKCEQCMVTYCESCRAKFHPSRGPLTTHILNPIGPISSQQTHTNTAIGRNQQNVNGNSNNKEQKVENSPSKRRSRTTSLTKPPSSVNGIKLSPCSFHMDENMSMYCDLCQVPLCYQCLEDGRHRSHEVKAIGATYKSHKTDLSQQMSALSNKARHAKDLVMHLRCVQEEIQKNSTDFEARAVAQCNALMDAINQKKQELVQRVNAEKEVKCKMVREQLQQCTMKLKQTTGLLEYCIEVMKDNDPAPFLQVSSGLIKRVSATEQQWTEHHLAPRAKSEFDFDLDATPLLQAIESFNITQRRIPEKPVIKVAECNNNTVTLSWKIPPTTPVDAFILEMDDGANGNFRNVYRGKNTVCIVDGLHFNSVYKARVSAFNKTGRSQYSDIVQLQTAEVAVFHMDSKQAHPDIKLSNNCRTVNCASNENRVVLGNIGFSRGMHYWEYSVDRYESSNPDVVFGVAQSKVDKSSILGKDKFAWAMYIDNSRTWFLHNNEHTDRYDGGVDVGSRLGVLLDIDKNQVTFYVNQKQRGKPVSFEDEDDEVTSHGKVRIFFPALSLNRQAQATLWSGQRPLVQMRPPLYHSHSFNGPVTSNSYKNRMVAKHGIATNNGNSNSVPRCSSKRLPSPTSTLQKQRRSQSSGDLKNQSYSVQRHYNSLPSQPVVKMNGSCTSVDKNDDNAKHPEDSKEIETDQKVNSTPTEKPAVKKKPPQLINAVQQARDRQQKQGVFKIPPQPPVRRGSVSSLSSSTKSSEGETNTLKTFQ